MTEIIIVGVSVVISVIAILIGVFIVWDFLDETYAPPPRSRRKPGEEE